MPHSFVQIYVHLTWATKYRRPVLVDNKRGLILKKIRTIAKTKGYQALIINGHTDHIHCLLRLRNSDSISRIINDLKGISANWINKNNILAEFFEWQEGYAAISVSPKNVKFIINYIYNQEMHHK